VLNNWNILPILEFLLLLNVVVLVIFIFNGNFSVESTLWTPFKRVPAISNGVIANTIRHFGL